jgi:uroporphyrinogen-III synthase
MDPHMIRVWVTRDEPAGGPLATALERAGLVAILEPVLTTAVTGDARPEIESLSPRDWLVLTSPRAVAAAAIPGGPGPRVAVVGESSARLARERGFRVEFVSPTGEADALWRHIAKVARGERVCFPRSSLASPPPLQAIELSAPVIYEVARRAFDRTNAAACDVVAVASPSAVESIAGQLGAVPLPAASIGPATTRALRSAHAALLTEAPRPGFDTLARAIANAFPCYTGSVPRA